MSTLTTEGLKRWFLNTHRQSPDDPAVFHIMMSPETDLELKVRFNSLYPDGSVLLNRPVPPWVMLCLRELENNLILVVTTRIIEHKITSLQLKAVMVSAPDADILRLQFHLRIRSEDKSGFNSYYTEIELTPSYLDLCTEIIEGVEMAFTEFYPSKL